MELCDEPVTLRHHVAQVRNIKFLLPVQPISNEGFFVVVFYCSIFSIEKKYLKVCKKYKI